MADDFDMSAFDIAHDEGAPPAKERPPTKKTAHTSSRGTGASRQGRVEIEYEHEQEAAPRERVKERVRR